jgi:uncharacterized protein YkwD
MGANGEGRAALRAEPTPRTFDLRTEGVVLRRHARTSALCCALATYLIVWGMLSSATAHASCARASAAPTGATAARFSARIAIRCLVNEQRRRHGLPPVLSSRRLRHAAEGLAGDMVRRKFFSHVTPGGSTVNSRVRRTGYLAGARSWALGETLAWGEASDATAAALVDALMHSPPHRAIILDRGFREIGVGIAFGVPERGAHAAGATVALDFGRRLVRHRVRRHGHARHRHMRRIGRLHTRTFAGML